jgi:hypothetical protein
MRRTRARMHRGIKPCPRKVIFDIVRQTDNAEKKSGKESDDRVHCD